jgi:drug/metabolite transporter (DMT)-like permease
VSAIVALVVLSAFLHALWNALLRVEPDKDRGLIAAVSVATLLALIVAGARWAVEATPPFQNAEAVAWALAAGVLEWLYFASLARALDRGTLGTVYTISRGGSVLLVWPLSVMVYAEQVTVWSIAGSAIVFVGLVLSGLGASDPRANRGGALAWAIACACSIAGYHLAYKAALHAGGSPSAVFAVALSLATAINVVATGSTGREAVARILRTRLPRVVLMGAICGGSFLILMEALSGGGAGFVLTLRNTSVLFATALAWTIGERPRHAQVVGAVFVAAGAIAMARQ